MDEIIDAIRRRRSGAIAEHTALMQALDDMESMALHAAALRDPPPEPEPTVEIAWNEIWRNHPAAEDFFRQFPDGIPEDRMQS